MPSTKNYKQLHDQVTARPGAAERLAKLRDQTHAEIGLYELRRALERSQTDLAASLGISQSAVSQLERGDDLKISTLRGYLDRLGCTLQLVAVYDDGETHTEIPLDINSQRAS